MVRVVRAVLDTIHIRIRELHFTSWVFFGILLRSTPLVNMKYATGGIPSIPEFFYSTSGRSTVEKKYTSTILSMMEIYLQQALFYCLVRRMESCRYPT